MSNTVLRAAILLAVGLISHAFLSPQSALGQIPWRHSPKETFDAAISSGKPILVYIETDWCHYCKQMKRETWRDPQVQAMASQRFVTLMLDGEHDKRIVEKLGLTGYPATLMYDSSGHFLKMKAGFLDPEKMLQWLESSKP